mmetsp:Transcript_39908/g.68494  ORF Transcript_39908/g.68494 Transcript_39908/m.68494 type:complete len:245 (+) Transcript_39908:182-916(+)
MVRKAGHWSRRAFCTAQKSSPQPRARWSWGTARRSPSASIGLQNLSLPLATYATCDAHPSRPSKMCVQYTIETPRTSDSSRRKARRSWRARRSRSVVISSSSSSLHGLSSLHRICTRRRCPSDTVVRFHFSSISRSWTSFATRAGSTPIEWEAMSRETSIAWYGTLCPTKLTVCVQLPVSSATSWESDVSWNAGRPITLTASGSTMCFPPMTFMSVDLPAPFEPMSRQRAPAGRAMSIAASCSL